MRRVAISLALFLAATLAFAQASAPSARQILDSVRRATGGAAWNQVVESISEGTFQVVVDGQEKSGAIRYVEDLRTGANTSSIKVPSLNFRRTAGDHPSGNWTLDDAGDVQVDPGPHSWQTNDLYITTRAYWRPNLGGAQITVLAPQADRDIIFERLQIRPHGGDPFTLWINHQSHLIERSENAGHFRYYYNYRRVHGVLLPFAERDDSGNRQITLWTSRRLLTTSDSAAAIPFHHDYTMPASGMVTVPAKNGMAFDVIVNGKGPYPVFVDTGSENLVTDNAARKLGLHLNGDAQPFNAGGGTVTAQTAQIDTIRIGGLILHDQTFYVIHAASEEVDEVPSIVLGYQTLRRFAIRIDPDRGQITFIDGAKFHYSGSGVQVPLSLIGHGIIADGSVNGNPARFVLDTGNEFCFELDSAYVRQHHLIESTGAHYRGYAGSGYGGASPEAFIARVDTVTLGGAAIHHIVTDLSTGNATGGGIAGNIGQSILLQFASTWDVIRGALYLEKTSGRDHTEVFNRAGLVTEPDDHGQRIKSVFSGTPGAAAGLAPNDLIVAIDGQTPTDELVIPAFLQPPGTVVHLKIQRGAETLNVAVTLKEIL
jgi:hypothetical protein